MRKFLTLSLLTFITFVAKAQIIMTIGDKKYDVSEIDSMVFKYVDQPSANTLMSATGEYSIFLEAMQRTGFSNMVLNYENEKEYFLNDPTYTDGSVLYYPTYRDEGWTVFAEKDVVLKETGINNFGDLAVKCAEWYASPSWYDYVKEKDITISTGTDYENEWNVVHMFVAYHILKHKLPVNKLVYERLVENENWNVCFGYEPQSYYETMLPGTLLKVWATDVNNSHLNPNLWVNRYVKNNTLTDQYGTFGSDAMHPVIYSGAQVDRASSLETPNCFVHSINNVLLYDQNTRDSQHERMRFSQNMLLPELANNGIYGSLETEISAKNNGGEGKRVAFTQDYFDNLHCNNKDTKLTYNVLSAWRAYESSQFQAWAFDMFDFSIRLPHIPTGKYELRIIYPPMARNGEIEYFIGTDSYAMETMTKLSTLDATENPCEEGNSMGCEQIGEPDYGVLSDKTMRQNGFMRAPASFSRGTNNMITQKLEYDPNDIYSAAKQIVGYTSCRSEWGYGLTMLRFIVGTVDIKQGKEYWLRIKGTVKDSNIGNQVLGAFNFVELVPTDVANNETYMEDWY